MEDYDDFIEQGDAIEGFTLKLSDVTPMGVISIYPTGSKFICNPPVLTTDEDYYAYTGNKDVTIEALLNDGWTLCTDNEYDDDAFTALRKGVYNLILLFSLSDYYTHVATTDFAKRLNLVNKQDRVDLFELVRNGSYE